ncbi:MAG: hypothetical protein IJV15_06540 [Lachnospiraceae bacterium]|nr:hypothetical protein [Lachnospiraceae bacterium]
MGKVVAVITGSIGGIGQEFVRQILNDKKVDAVCLGWVDTEMLKTAGLLIVISQFAVVPLYYLFFGLWKSNYLLAGTAALFFIIHSINGVMNFIIKK